MTQATITLQIDTEQQLSLNQLATELACEPTDLIKQAIAAYLTTHSPKRSTFGVMRHTGQIIGDIVEPIVPESDWEVLK